MIKLIALVAMFFDHAAVYFYPQFTFPFRSFGVISFPLFSWGISQGVLYTRDHSKYFISIVFCAFFTQPFYYFLNPDSFRFNDLFTLLAAACILYLVQTYADKRYYLLCLPLILLKIINIYILIPLFIYEFRGHKCMIFIFSSLFFCSVWYLTKKNFLLFGPCFAVLLFFADHLPRIPKLKPLFYIAYPLHYLVMAVLKM